MGRSRSRPLRPPRFIYDPCELALQRGIWSLNPRINASEAQPLGPRPRRSRSPLLRARSGGASSSAAAASSLRSRARTTDQRAGRPCPMPPPPLSAKKSARPAAAAAAGEEAAAAADPAPRSPRGRPSYPTVASRSALGWSFEKLTQYGYRRKWTCQKLHSSWTGTSHCRTPTMRAFEREQFSDRIFLEEDADL